MPISRDEFRSWNDAMAIKYNPDDYHRRSPALVRWMERRRVRKIVGMLALKPTERVLEIGCGAGNVLESLGMGTLFGIDLSEALLRIAKTKRYAADCHLLQSYGECLPFPDKSFDKVICSEVLEHVPDPEAICAEISRVLTDNGRFVVSVPNEKLINSVKRGLLVTGVWPLLSAISGYRFSKNMTDEWHLHEFDKSRLQGLLGRFFKVGAVAGSPFGPVPLRFVAWCEKAA
ncbi:MAG: class I SAM-dependent methyltransferase [Thermodesulfobacteriota bacterium]